MFSANLPANYPKWFNLIGYATRRWGQMIHFFPHFIPSFKLSRFPLIFSFYDPPFTSSFFTAQISTSASQELPGVISIARVSTLQALSVVFVGQVTQEMVLFVTVGYNVFSYSLILMSNPSRRLPVDYERKHSSKFVLEVLLNVSTR